MHAIYRCMKYTEYVYRIARIRCAAIDACHNLDRQSSNNRDLLKNINIYIISLC